MDTEQLIREVAERYSTLAPMIKPNDFIDTDHVSVVNFLNAVYKAVGLEPWKIDHVSICVSFWVKNVIYTEYLMQLSIKELAQRMDNHVANAVMQQIERC
jgi:hypothetical protein